MIQQLHITTSDLAQARAEANQLGHLNGSIMHGQRNTYGILGEILLANFINAHRCPCFHYDMTANGFKIDAKSKAVSSTPTPDHECSIFWNSHQLCDYYVFLRIKLDFSRAWLLGAISKSEFLKRAYSVRAGSISSNGLKLRADSLNLPIRYLHPIVPTKRILAPSAPPQSAFHKPIQLELFAVHHFSR